MPLSSGERLGPYELLAQIGAGGMGEVWKARDTRLDRIVAIKRLKGEHGERFAREARAIAALNHPHICQIYDVGREQMAGRQASHGVILPFANLLIGATALHHGCAVVTENVRRFEAIPDLVVKQL